MRLGVDGTPLIGKRTGIGKWTSFLVRELPAHIPGLEIVLYTRPGRQPDLPPAMERYSLRCGSGFQMLPSYFWMKWRANALLMHDNIDVFWATRTLYPAGLERRMPVVSTIHDLNSVFYPNTMPFANLLAHKLWFSSDLLKSDRIVANSLGTSEKLLGWLGRGADAIVRPGVSDQYVPQPQDTVAKSILKYGITTPYLLFVGTLEPRKNLANLLVALEAINADLSTPLSLVLIGQRGWRNRALISRLDRGIPHVKELGFVPDEELPGLYTGATALMMPSVYEGYGMPAAEAAACGTWVVATDIPELREAAGCSGIYIEPSVPGIISGIRKVLAIDSRPTRSTPVSWGDSARVLARVLQEAASSRRNHP